VIKRHNFHGHKGSHGTHESFRGPGSLGAGTSPGRVWKGMRMAGHYGDHKVMIKNLQIVEIIAEKNLVLVKGAVPGAHNSIVELVKA
jgi:large subunit ribosomal protein L3